MQEEGELKLLLDRVNKETQPLVKTGLEVFQNQCPVVDKHRVPNIQKISARQSRSSFVHASSRDHDSMQGAMTFGQPSDSERNAKFNPETQLQMSFDARMLTMPMRSACRLTEEQQGSVEGKIVALTSAR